METYLYQIRLRNATPVITLFVSNADIATISAYEVICKFRIKEKKPKIVLDSGTIHIYPTPDKSTYR